MVPPDILHDDPLDSAGNITFGRTDPQEDARKGPSGEPGQTFTPFTPVAADVAATRTGSPLMRRMRRTWWALTSRDWRPKATAIALIAAIALSVAAVSTAIWRANNLYGVDGELKRWALSTRDTDNDVPSSDLVNQSTDTTDGDAAADVDGTPSGGGASGTNGTTNGTNQNAGSQPGQSGGSSDTTPSTPSTPSDGGTDTPDVQPDDKPIQPSDPTDPDTDDSLWTGYY